ncbi:hypothetical protein OUZ56_007980 [Daphnia magna]|uniref:Uncharacterized protein n=1 Tax=Daphnia magna TaxID=35525 RepID=A0ABR0ABL1_9CRUS|nr:hypothetical protein OUZ56_007980 [Daphnia magna]
MQISSIELRFPHSTQIRFIIPYLLSASAVSIIYEKWKKSKPRLFLFKIIGSQLELSVEFRIRRKVKFVQLNISEFEEKIICPKSPVTYTSSSTSILDNEVASAIIKELTKMIVVNSELFLNPDGEFRAFDRLYGFFPIKKKKFY